QLLQRPRLHLSPAGGQKPAAAGALPLVRKEGGLPGAGKSLPPLLLPGGSSTHPAQHLGADSGPTVTHWQRKDTTMAEDRQRAPAARLSAVIRQLIPQRGQDSDQLGPMMRAIKAVHSVTGSGSTDPEDLERQRA